MKENIVKDEIYKVNARTSFSEFEDSVRSDIMIWGYEINLKRLSEGKEPMKFDKFEDLCRAYWDDMLSDMGKPRIVNGAITTERIL
jgi:hypothetical protein